VTLTFENYQDSVNMNQRAKYLGQRSFTSTVIILTDTETHTNIHTHRTDCSIWTTK